MPTPSIPGTQFSSVTVKNIFKLSSSLIKVESITEQPVIPSVTVTIYLPAKSLPRVGVVAKPSFHVKVGLDALVVTVIKPFLAPGQEMSVESKRTVNCG